MAQISLIGEIFVYVLFERHFIAVPGLANFLLVMFEKTPVFGDRGAAVKYLDTRQFVTLLTRFEQRDQRAGRVDTARS